MTDFFVDGDVKIRAIFQRYALVLNEFCKSKQYCDGQLVVKKTAFYVARLCNATARIEANYVTNLDSQLSGVLFGADNLIKHHLGGVEVAF